jgi:DNA-binding transcriptional ArsR family regulator
VTIAVSYYLPLVTAYSHAMDALGDPTRREIMERLRESPKAVGELARELPVSRPAVSQHLRILKDAGLVRDSKDGTRRLYRVDPDAIEQLRLYFERFWADALDQLSAAAKDTRRGGVA